MTTQPFKVVDPIDLSASTSCNFARLRSFNLLDLLISMH